MFRYLLQPLLQLLRFEQAHRLVVLLLRVIGLIPGGRWLLGRCYAVEHPSLEREVFGVKFRNPIGVAAGIDRNGEICNELGAMGFGFVEVGTLTPHGQSGNPTPRVFRSDDERSIRHRVGHANRGLQSAIRHLRHGHPGVVVGCNLACNASTPAEEAPKDVLKLFRNLYQYVDYFTVNVSGDDVQNEQLTHSEAYIRALLEPLFDFRRGQNQYRPILLKISPDLTDEEVDRITDILIATPLDGIVATNGSFHDTVHLSAQRKAGRVSGAPVWKEKFGTGKSVNFPSGQAAKGNPGVAGIIKQTKNSIGYVGSEYAFAQKIAYAKIQNLQGEFVEPSAESISAAASGEIPADTRCSITNADAAGAYPISTFTWMIIYK
ncbi:MAG: dihydroorotate dehydrogenase (quinone), partial [Alistipes sp.]|nr:dihydroorotate dehydrogenase (quinone) [Alistipes sp.]